MRTSRGARLALLAAVAALGCAGAPDQEPAKPLTKVRMAFSRHLSWGPLMIAQAEGFFRDEGLDVEFVPLTRPDESLVALVTGDIDVRPGPLSAGVLSAIARQAPIRIAAGQGNLNGGSCTYYGIVLRPGLDSVKGKPRIRRMRASESGATRFVVAQMLAKEGITIHDVEAVRLPDAVMGTALETGSLDAVAASEPSLSRLKKKGTLWLSGEDAVPGFQWAVVAFGDRLLNRDRETGTRFIRAYLRGIAQYRQGKTDRNVAIIAEGTQETAEHIRDVCWPDFDPGGRINWESIAAYEAWAKTEGLMLKTVSQDQAFDSAFVTAAARDNSAGMP
jgi:NitT/TauT family transport system substrate-binding protein